MARTEGTIRPEGKVRTGPFLGKYYLLGLYKLNKSSTSMNGRDGPLGPLLTIRTIASGPFRLLLLDLFSAITGPDSTYLPLLSLGPYQPNRPFGRAQRTGNMLHKGPGQ